MSTASATSTDTVIFEDAAESEVAEDVGEPPTLPSLAHEFRRVFTLAQSAEEFCGRDAAMCLGNLAVISYNQFQISELGGLGPLSDLLKREFVSTQLVLSIDSVPTPRTSIVLWTPVLFLRLWLGWNSSNEQNIMKACAMRALVDLLRSPSVECSKHAAMELCNLTANPANQLHLGCKTMVLTRL
ncbi:hypothetical protein PC128_g6241 [Phytophthora cactorum]|nr:hypothetical protein PC128_g6241 [Phytophthora cactorum]